MRLFNSTLFVLCLIVVSGCGRALEDSSSTPTAAQAQPIPSGRQDTHIYLPNIVGGKAEVAATTSDGQEWLRYNHAYWGTTFDYPAGWQVDIPDLEAGVEPPDEEANALNGGVYFNNTDMQRATTYGYVITLKPVERTVGASDIIISLETHVLAPEMPLREWIKIRKQNLLWFHGDDWENYAPKLVPFSGEARPNVDEIWVDLAENTHGLATVYMSIGKLVYAIRFAPEDPALQKLVEHIVSSLEFDLDKQRELAALPFYSAEITGLQPFPDEPTPVPDEPPSETPASP